MANSEADQRTQDDIRQVQEVVSRYVAQLLHGCNNTSCTESLCFTGHQNTTRRPLRKHTPRSARAFALTLAGQPNPRSHYCKYYAAGANSSSQNGLSEGPSDPTAFMQQLCDTRIIRSLCDPESGNEAHRLLTKSVRMAPCNGISSGMFADWNRRLDDLEKAQGNRAYPTKDETRQEHALNELAGCIEFLISTLPASTPGQWAYVQKIFIDGSTVPSQTSGAPSDEVFNNWVTILDRMQDHRSNRLLSRTLLIAKRCEFLAYDTSSTGVRTGRMLVATVLRRLTTNDPTDVVLLVAEKHWTQSLYALTLWLKYIFLQRWNHKCLLEEDSAAESALIFLGQKQTKLDVGTRVAEPDAAIIYAIPTISRQLESRVIVESWLASMSSVDRSVEGRRKALHLFDFKFVFMKEDVSTHFKTMNFLVMRDAHVMCKKAFQMRQKLAAGGIEVIPDGPLKYLESHYLLLNVGRESVLRDTFDQLWQRRSDELRRALRVRLGEMDEFEVGQDLGGVQIEFFNLLCKEVLSESAQMFTTDSITGLSYFRPGSVQPLYMFELFGLCFGLALYNGITLPVSFPMAFYYRLLDQDVTSLEILQDGWSTIFQSLNSILNEDLDLTGMDAVLPMEANGLRLSVLSPDRAVSDTDSESSGSNSGRIHLSVLEVNSIAHHTDEAFTKSTEQKESNPIHPPPPVDIDDIADAWPGWHLERSSHPPPELTAENKRTYVRDYTRWLVSDSIRPQWTSFLTGVHHILPPHRLAPLTPHNLRAITEGTRHLDVSALRHATTYRDYSPISRYMQSFWRIVSSWTEEKQMQLVKFVTAAERLPVGGAADVTFVIQRAGAGDDGALPTSSTCFGTLFLPKYESAEVLERKLTVAVEYGMEGFGTG